MKLFMNEKNDIGRDISHLVFALSTRNDPIPVELIGILVNCLEDPFYMETAKFDLVTLAKTNKSIKASLENIVNNNDGKFNDIKPLSEEILIEAAKRNYPESPNMR